MKRLADLTIEDLTAAPVWRYEGGSGAEAVVAAEQRDALSQMDDEVFLAATDFLLPDSSRHLGFCFPVDDGGVDYLQPVIVTPSGHVRFWFDGPAAREVLAAQWSALGKRDEEIFPVRFRCRVPVDGRKVAGVIPGVETSADILPVASRRARRGLRTGNGGGRLRIPAPGCAPSSSARPSACGGSSASRAGVSETRDGPPAQGRDDGRVRPGRRRAAAA